MCVYRSPVGDIGVFMDNLDRLINKLVINKTNNVNKQIILCGDFNIDLMDKNNNITKMFVDMLDGLNLKCVITDPTRISFQRASCIDNIIVDKNSIFNSRVIKSDLSDHFDNT